MKYELPKLSYAYNALEPYIDARTMEIHHAKHHQAYTDKMNTVLEKYPASSEKPLEELMKNWHELDMPNDDKTAFRNNGGGYLNHKLYWEIMGPKKEIDEKLKEEIEKEFVTIEEFKNKFSQTAVNCFGSGWAWLVRAPEGQLKIYATPNQDSPYLNGDLPLITLDVWEHAYYLKYQNKRNEYVENWWNVLKLI